MTIQRQTQNVKLRNPSQQQLNSLLEAYQSQRYSQAEKLAISLTEQFPEHQFSWKVLGALLGHFGRLSEALKANQKAVSLSPTDAEAHNNMGNTLKVLGKLDEAKAIYTRAIELKYDYAEAHNNLGVTLKELSKLDEAETSLGKAITLKPSFAEAHNNLGITLKEQGRLDEAEIKLVRAIELKPDYAVAHNNLGATLQELGKFSEAEASYKHAIALKPDYAEAYNNLGITLKELGRLTDAEVSYKKAIALKPNFAEVHSNLGTILKDLGRLDEAAASLKQAISIKPDLDEDHNTLLKCLYEIDNPSVFFDELDRSINQDKTNAVIGSLICRSTLKYGLKRSNVFCENPLKYVLQTDLNTKYDFKEIFVKKARSILNEKNLSNRKQSLIIEGYQTFGNLFDIEKDFTEQIQNAIRLEIEKYRINFKNSSEGFIKKWPTEYTLYGWLISMKSGGELKPHIHERGWLSGSIYINVPSKSKSDSGNLVVSLGEDEDSTDTRINLNKTINVVTGNLVLFPASLTHYTIPFESEEDRIVLAFDVIAK